MVLQHVCLTPTQGPLPQTKLLAPTCYFATNRLPLRAIAKKVDQMMRSVVRLQKYIRFALLCLRCGFSLLFPTDLFSGLHLRNTGFVRKLPNSRLLLYVCVEQQCSRNARFSLADACTSGTLPPAAENTQVWPLAYEIFTDEMHGRTTPPGERLSKLGGYSALNASDHCDLLYQSGDDDVTSPPQGTAGN